MKINKVTVIGAGAVGAVIAEPLKMNALRSFRFILKTGSEVDFIDRV